MNTLSTEYLARISALHPWRVLGIWAVVFVVAFGVIGAAFADALTTEFRPTNNPDSKQAQTLIDDRITGIETVPETVLVRSETARRSSPARSASTAPATSHSSRPTATRPSSRSA
jgi:hypothetical protein